MRQNSGTNKAFFLLVLSSSWSPSVDALVCCEDLAHTADFFSVQCRPPLFHGADHTSILW